MVIADSVLLKLGQRGEKRRSVIVFYPDVDLHSLVLSKMWSCRVLCADTAAFI